MTPLFPHLAPPEARQRERGRNLAPSITSPYTPPSMPARPASFVLAGTLVAVAGCSGQVIATADADAAQTYALVSVELSSPAGELAEGVRTQASARFLRMPSSTDLDLASHLVGAGLELPPVDQCTQVAVFAEERGFPLASFGPIDLIDVGAVTIQAGSARASLSARAFPDVVDLVSGVVYTTREAVDSFPAPATYRIEIAGSSQLGPLRLEAPAPAPPQAVRIAAQPLGTEPVAVAREDLALSWIPGSGDGLVYVELTSYEASRLVRNVCTFADTGRATIPAHALPDAASTSIALHRIERLPVEAKGIDGGEVRFDLAVTGTLRFEVLEPIEAIEEP